MQVSVQRLAALTVSALEPVFGTVGVTLKQTSPNWEAWRIIKPCQHFTWFNFLGWKLKPAWYLLFQSSNLEQFIILI